jgi:signal transduction histidine kinase
VIARDITLRKAAENALRESKKRFQQLAATAQANLDELELILTHMREVVMIFDSSGKIMRVNPAGLNMLEDPSSQAGDLEARGKIHEILTPDGQPLPLEAWPIARALRGETVVDAEYIYHRRSSETKWRGLLNAVPIRDGQDQIKMILITVVDITSLREMQDRYIAAQAWMNVQHSLIDQREQERLQIARDLHDGPAQELSAAIFILQDLLEQTSDPLTVEKLRGLKTMIQEQNNELRTFAIELRPPALSRFGLVTAIRSHIETFQIKHPELKIELETDQEVDALSDTERVAFFRIYQESLNNCVRHAGARNVLVRLRKTQAHFILEIEDNGVGFDLPEDWVDLASQGHLGLLGIRERVEAIGGQIEIITHPGQGTLLRVTLATR